MTTKYSFASVLAIVSSSILISVFMVRVDALPAPKPAPFLIPTGIKLPPNLMNQVIPTSNPYDPVRPEDIPPSPSASPTSASKSYFTFVAKDFFIILAGVLGFLGLAIGLLMVWRYIKGDQDLTKQWETETEKAARRTEEVAQKRKWFRENEKKAKLRKEPKAKEIEKLQLEFQSD